MSKIYEKEVVRESRTIVVGGFFGSDPISELVQRKQLVVLCRSGRFGWAEQLPHLVASVDEARRSQEEIHITSEHGSLESNFCIAIVHAAIGDASDCQRGAFTVEGSKHRPVGTR